MRLSSASSSGGGPSSDSASSPNESSATGLGRGTEPSEEIRVERRWSLRWRNGLAGAGKHRQANEEKSAALLDLKRAAAHQRDHVCERHAPIVGGNRWCDPAAQEDPPQKTSPLSSSTGGRERLKPRCETLRRIFSTARGRTLQLLYGARSNRHRQAHAHPAIANRSPSIEAIGAGVSVSSQWQSRTQCMHRSRSN